MFVIHLAEDIDRDEVAGISVALENKLGDLGVFVDRVEFVEPSSAAGKAVENATPAARAVWPIDLEPGHVIVSPDLGRVVKVHPAEYATGVVLADGRRTQLVNGQAVEVRR